jgi:hypothetical protein
MSLFPGGGAPSRPAPPPPPPYIPPPPPPEPPEPEGKKVDKLTARRRAGRQGATLTSSTGVSDGLGNVSRTQAGGSDKLG